MVPLYTYIYMVIFSHLTIYAVEKILGVLLFVVIDVHVYSVNVSTK